MWTPPFPFPRPTPAEIEPTVRSAAPRSSPPPATSIARIGILLPTCIDEPPLVDADARSGQIPAAARVEPLNGRVERRVRPNGQPLRADPQLGQRCTDPS